MNILISILVSTFIVSLISFVGVLILFFKEKILSKVLLFFVAFSAGALIGGAFLHLIPEAVEMTNESGGDMINIFLYLIFGFLFFYILEEFIFWHHHHTIHCEECPGIKPFSYLILLSDSVHNFIDGLIIAGAFVVSFPLGIATTLAVISHEIPQEIGDFATLVYGGIKKTKALFLNFASGLIAVLGGIIGFFLSGSIGSFSVFLLVFASGNFIYIAASDLMPEIRSHAKEKKSLNYFLLFVLGICFMFLIRFVGIE